MSDKNYGNYGEWRTSVLTAPPKTEYPPTPWKHTDSVLAFILLVAFFLLLICSPAIVVGVYRWLW